MSAIGLLPRRFELNGKMVLGSEPKLRWTFWVLNFCLCILYVCYINITLGYTALTGLYGVRYDQLGVHILRALITTCFSYWMYEFFVKFPGNHKLLYNFTQANPGKVFSWTNDSYIRHE